MKIDFINTLFKNRESAEATASHSRAWQVSSIYPYLNMPSLVTLEKVETCDFFFLVKPQRHIASISVYSTSTLQTGGYHPLGETFPKACSPKTKNDAITDVAHPCYQVAHPCTCIDKAYPL